MTLNNSILDRLPGHVPKSDISVAESHTFVADDDGVETQYQLDKAPYEDLQRVRATVDGVTRDLDIGDEVEPRDTTSDGFYDAVAFVDESAYPDVGTSFDVEYVAEPIVVRFTEAFDSDLEDLGNRIDEAELGKYVDTGEGENLDRIGAMFGEIGMRQGRTDEEYRRFLRSVVRAFNARGTKDDIKFSVAAAVQGDPEDVEIVEDFEQTGFEVVIDQVDAGAVTSALNELIELSSPSGVELLNPALLILPGGSFVVAGGEMTVSRDPGIGSSTLGSETLG